MDDTHKRIGEEFSICGTCGYERGFHVSFEKRGTKFEVVLICPECGQRFRVGWVTSLA